MARLRYTEFTSNECLPSAQDDNRGDLSNDDMEHSVLKAIEGLEDLVMKMSIGEKAMFFASFDLGCVRALQVGVAAAAETSVLLLLFSSPPHVS
jgi:hypothetical protein